MSSEERKVPELRFKGFSDDWEQRKLGELAEIVRGASPRPIKDKKWFDQNSDVGWLRISDVTEQNGKIYYLTQRLSSIGQKKTRVVNEPHLLLSIAASVGKPVINYVRTGVHDGFLIFLNPSFNIIFLFEWLENFRLNWNKYGQPGSQVNLNSEIVKNQSLLIPELDEQHIISNFLEKLSNVVELHQRKLTMIKKVRKTLISYFFVDDYFSKIPNIRFSGYNNPWFSKAFKELTKYKSSNYSLNKVIEQNTDKLYPIFDANNEISKISEYDQEEEYISIIKDGAGIGRSQIRPGKSSIIATMGYISTNENDLYFIYTLMNKINWSKYKTGSTIPHIYFRDYGKEQFFIPELYEQRDIGNFFKKLDEKIQLCQNKINRLEKIKRIYLNKMFI